MSVFSLFGGAQIFGRIFLFLSFFSVLYLSLFHGYVRSAVQRLQEGVVAYCRAYFSVKLYAAEVLTVNSLKRNSLSQQSIVFGFHECLLNRSEPYSRARISFCFSRIHLPFHATFQSPVYQLAFILDSVLFFAFRSVDTTFQNNCLKSRRTKSLYNSVGINRIV